MDKLKFAVEATIFELKDDPTFHQRVRNKDLINTAWARLRGAGFLIACDRCSGTGHCGPAQVYGGTCFKCGGSKYSMPRFTQKWQKDVANYDWRKYMEDHRKAKGDST